MALTIENLTWLSECELKAYMAMLESVLEDRIMERRAKIETENRMRV